MWVAFLALLVAGMALIVMGWLGLQGRLPRQAFAGIRTPYAMANDEQWEAVHRFGAPWMVFGGVACVAGSLALLPFSLAGELPGAFSAAAALALALVVLGATFAAWYTGVRGAKAHLGR